MSTAQTLPIPELLFATDKTVPHGVHCGNQTIDKAASKFLEKVLHCVHRGFQGFTCMHCMCDTVSHSTQNMVHQHRVCATPPVHTHIMQAGKHQTSSTRQGM